MDIGKIKELAPKALKLLIKHKYALIVAVVGILLLVFTPTLTGAEDKKADAPSDGSDALEQAEGGREFSVEEVEARLAEVLADTKGVGRVKVMLALKTGAENVYAGESRDSSRVTRDESTVYEETKDGETSLKTIQQDGGESPVVVKTIYPEYMGAIIICDGADNAAVRGQVLSAVQSVTGITSERVSILKMKDG